MYNTMNKNINIPNITVKAELLMGEKRISKAISTTRTNARLSNRNQSNHKSQSSTLLNLFNKISNPIISPRESLYSHVQKPPSVNKDYPAVLTTESSQRVYTMPNKTVSKDKLTNGPVLTEQSVNNVTHIHFANEIKIPSKIKDKVNNLRLYSKPNKVIENLVNNNKIGKFKNLPNKNNLINKNLDFKSSFQLINNNRVPTIANVKSKGVKSLASFNLTKKELQLSINLNPEEKVIPRSKDKVLKDNFLANNKNNINNKNLAHQVAQLKKKKKDSSKQEQFKQTYENEDIKSIDKSGYVSDENNNNSEDALSVGEVQDIIKSFNFDSNEYKENNLFGSKKENHFNTNLKSKYVNYLFTSVIQENK
jgi:hypothetical protein